MENKSPMPWSSYAFRTALYTFIWWILTDGGATSWWIGIPAIGLALLTSIQLTPPITPVWMEWLRFIPFFISRSFSGGVDVAWRAFHPRMPIAPDLIEYRVRLPHGPAQVFFINTINLLPGTLGAYLDQNVMQVHVLDRNQNFISELSLVEETVSSLFGIQLPPLSGEAHATI